MCGIAGIFDLSGRLGRDTLGQWAERMADNLRHRGPDDSGLWVSPDGRCAFSHRRLSVVDLSPGGHQPMMDGAATITFNGEIYNHKELRATLATKGHVFHTSSDTEVLLHGLAAEGKTFIDRLDAMFAFGYYDAQHQTLVLARDAFGEKPLYYAATADWFAFASELQALTLLPGFDAAIDDHRIATYLALGYLPSPLTIYKGARKLPPGHILTLKPDGHISIERYFHFSASPLQSDKHSLDDLTDELEGLLTETIRTRLIADVPLGAFLSGGVDSSTVVALAMKQLPRPMKTFSIGFENDANSEHNEARAIAAHLGTEHDEELLPAGAFDIRHHLPAILDEPNADSSCMPTWLVSKATRRQVTVALSGDGGDELFGGYQRYKNMLKKAEAGGPKLRLGDAYYSHPIMLFTDSALEKFAGGVPAETRQLLHDLRAPLNAQSKPFIQHMRETDIENYLPGDILAKVDRMSMHHALEVRSPLLGRAVADFAMRLAADQLCTMQQTKPVLKNLAARYLPREWMDRPKKGFSIPLTEAWGGANLAREIENLLTGPDCHLAAWIAPEKLRRFVDYHLATPKFYHMWPIFMLEHWLRTHPGKPC